MKSLIYFNLKRELTSKLLHYICTWGSCLLCLWYVLPTSPTHFPGNPLSYFNNSGLRSRRKSQHEYASHYWHSQYLPKAQNHNMVAIQIRNSHGYAGTKKIPPLFSFFTLINKSRSWTLGLGRLFFLTTLIKILHPDFRTFTTRWWGTSKQAGSFVSSYNLTRMDIFNLHVLPTKRQAACLFPINLY